MKAIALTETVTAGNPVAHDLQLTNGQFTLLEESAALALSLSCDLQLFLGEWFLDTREGIPFYRDIFRKNPSIPLITSIFRRAILQKEGISHLAEFALDYDPRARTLALSFEAVTTTGERIDFTSPPLVLGLP